MMPSMGIERMNSKIREVTEPDPALVCIFCQKHEINSVEWGSMYQLNDVAVHYFCLLFSSGLSQKGADNEGIWGFLTPDILKEAKRGDKLKCKYCKKTRATVGCVVRSCKSSFHYTCGLSKGTLHQFYGQFCSYCPSHKPQQRIPDGVEYNCPICFVDLEKESDGVWPPCCGKSMFHRRCLMQFAKEAGYFFKCPLCNNSTQKFLLEMKANGVFVPEQDAAWEREPNAFAELTQQYSNCDAPTCLCPNGRDHNSAENGNWKIIRCSCCGASAMHAKCGDIRGLSWKCKTCSTVLLDNSSIDTSSLIRTRGSRRAGVDEGNLNYTDDDDETSTSEGDAFSSDDSDTSDEEEKILRRVPNPSTFVRRLSSSSDDNDCSQSQPGPSHSAPGHNKKTNHDEKIAGPKMERRKRKRRQRIHRVKVFPDQESKRCEDVTINSNCGNNQVAHFKIRMKHHIRKRSKKNRRNELTSNAHTSDISGHKVGSEADSTHTEDALRKLNAMLDQPRSFTAKMKNDAKKHQETLQSVLQAANEQRVDMTKLPKIPKIAPGERKSNHVLHPERKSILEVQNRIDISIKSFHKKERRHCAPTSTIFQPIIGPTLLSDPPPPIEQCNNLNPPTFDLAQTYVNQHHEYGYPSASAMEWLQSHNPCPSTATTSFITQDDRQKYNEIPWFHNSTPNVPWYQNQNGVPWYKDPNCYRNNLETINSARSSEYCASTSRETDLKYEYEQIPTTFKNPMFCHNPHFVSPNKKKSKILNPAYDKSNATVIEDRRFKAQVSTKKQDLCASTTPDGQSLPRSSMQSEQKVIPFASESGNEKTVQVIDLDGSEDEIEIVGAKIVTLPKINDTVTAKSSAFVSLLSDSRRHAYQSNTSDRYWPGPSSSSSYFGTNDFYHDSYTTYMPHDYWANTQRLQKGGNGDIGESS